MDYIYAKLNLEEILKEYTADNSEGTADISINNDKNVMAVKVKKTPGTLIITKGDEDAKKELARFDGSSTVELNLDSANGYRGIDNDSIDTHVDTDNNTIEVEFKKTKGTLRFTKASLPLDREFDGSYDATIDIPQTIITTQCPDNTMSIAVGNGNNRANITAQVNKVPNKLVVYQANGTVSEYDGSQSVIVNIPNLNTNEYYKKSDVDGFVALLTREIEELKSRIGDNN